MTVMQLILVVGKVGDSGCAFLKFEALLTSTEVMCTK